MSFENSHVACPYLSFKAEVADIFCCGLRKSEHPKSTPCINRESEPNFNKGDRAF